MTLWGFTAFDIFLYGLTAITTHLLMSLGQTLFHRYLGHHRLGGRFFIRHLQFHHAFYSGNHIISSDHPNNEGNNTPFFLIPTALVIGLSYFLLPLDLFFVQILAMSLSFGAHVYLDKQYHIAGSWLRRLSWFRKKQQLHLVHPRHANCHFAMIDYFSDPVRGP